MCLSLVDGKRKMKFGILFLVSLCFVFAACVPLRASQTSRIKSGDWIKYESKNIGEVPFVSVWSWAKVEFVNVTESKATISVTMHLSNGSERIRTSSINMVSDSNASGGFSGFVISTELKAGDSILISGIGDATIAGETTRTYAGVNRTVFYSPFSQWGMEGAQVTSYWDKQTGIFVEETGTSSNYTMSFTATETNMWSPELLEGVYPWLFIIIIVAVAIAGAAIASMLLRRKSQQPNFRSTSKKSEEQRRESAIFN